jgi:hypothetical protein
MPINCSRRLLLFEDEVQPSCFSEERVRLGDLSLLVGVTVYLEGCLHLRNRKRVRGKGKKVEGRSERDTNLAVFVRFANVEKRASATLVLFTAHDRVHRT